MGIVAEKYARALIISALKDNAVLKIKDDFKAFLDVLNNNKELNFILLNWSMPYEFEKRLLNEIFGKSINQLFLKFLEVILKRKREKELFCIFEKYCELADDAVNNLRVTIITAVPLNNDQEQAIKKIFGGKYNKHIIIDKLLDDSLIGGGIIKIKDKILDMSIKTRIENLRKELVTC